MSTERSANKGFILNGPFTVMPPFLSKRKDRESLDRLFFSREIFSALRPRLFIIILTGCDVVRSLKDNFPFSTMTSFRLNANFLSASFFTSFLSSFLSSPFFFAAAFFSSINFWRFSTPSLSLSKDTSGELINTLETSRVFWIGSRDFISISVEGSLNMSLLCRSSPASFLIFMDPLMTMEGGLSLYSTKDTLEAISRLPERSLKFIFAGI